MIADTLLDIPPRQGEPPLICPIAPFYQLTQTAPITVSQHLRRWVLDSRAFGPYTRLSDDSVALSGSPVEGSETSPTVADSVILRQDGSCLLALDQLTADYVLLRRWGELVVLPDTDQASPWLSVLLYAPRNRWEQGFSQMIINLTFHVSSDAAAHAAVALPECS